MELSNLIRARRELKGIPRTTFAKMAGISPNSMVKYEMSVLEGGKVPGTENLATICELLEIDPRDAFDAINRGALLKKYQEHPETRPSEGAPPDSQFSFAHHFRTDDEWHQMSLSVTDLDSLDSNFAQIHYELHRMNERFQRLEKMQNGPDQNDPSRSEETSNNPEAVGAASTKHTEGSD